MSERAVPVESVEVFETSDGEPSIGELELAPAPAAWSSAQTITRMAYSVGGTALIQISNFMSGIALARLLGPEHRGELSQIIAWYSFFTSVLLLGLNDSLVYFKARGEDSARVLSTAAAGVIFTALLAILACTFVYEVHLTSLPENARLSAIVFILFAPSYQILQILVSYFQTAKSHVIWSTLRVLPGPLYVIFIYAAYSLGHSTVLGMVIANLGSQLIPILIGLGAIVLERPSPNIPSFAELRRFFGYGSLLIMQRVSIVSRDNLDRMVLPFFVGAAIFGNYVVAATCSYLIIIFGISVDLVAFPAVARQPDSAAKRRLAEAFISGTIFITALGVVVLIPLAPTLVIVLFGDSYRSAAPLVMFFLFSGALQAIRTVLGGMFKAFARGGSLAWVETVNSVLMLLVIVGLARREGVLAGALAHLISAVVSCSLALYLAARHLGLSPARMISPVNALKDGYALYRRATRHRSI